MAPLTSDVAVLLPPGALAALEQALSRPLSYTVRFVLTPLPERRLVVILGEAHLKLSQASILGQALVNCFALRGVETFQRRQVSAGRLLGFLSWQGQQFSAQRSHPVARVCATRDCV